MDMHVVWQQAREFSSRSVPAGRVGKYAPRLRLSVTRRAFVFRDVQHPSTSKWVEIVFQVCWEFVLDKNAKTR